MYDFIFTPIKVKKKDFYLWLKQTLLDNNWKNISSKPSTENDIFYSTGELGNEEIMFRMKEYYNNQTTQALSNSTDVYLPVYPLRSYTPGINGAPGVMIPSTTATGFYNNRIARSAISADTEMTIYYHCNKDRIVFIIEWPMYTGLDSTFHLFGKPFGTIAKKPMTNRTVTLSGYAYSSNSPAIADIADIDHSSFHSGNFNYLNTNKTKSLNKVFFMSELCIVNNTDGFYSMVDGIYAINGDSSITSYTALKGDELVDEEGKVYRISSITRSHGNYPAVPFPLIAFRIL